MNQNKKTDFEQKNYKQEAYGDEDNKNVENRKDRDLPRDPSYPGSHKAPPGSVKLDTHASTTNASKNQQYGSSKSTEYGQGGSMQSGGQQARGQQYGSQKTGQGQASGGSGKLYTEFQQVQDAVKRGEASIRANCDFNLNDAQSKETRKALEDAGYHQAGNSTQNTKEFTWVRK